MRLIEATPTNDLELVISGIIDAPRERVYAAYTDAETLKQWFAPKPFQITAATVDPRPGGEFSFVMRGPDGTEYPGPGVVLEAMPNEKLVITDAYAPGWVPAAEPFMTAIVTFEGAEGGTKVTARARHRNAEAVAQHKAMNFHEGWGQTMAQLAEIVEANP